MQRQGDQGLHPLSPVTLILVRAPACTEINCHLVEKYMPVLQELFNNGI